MSNLKPCPFCGSKNIDPRGWASTDDAGPGCDDCSGTAKTIELWNARPMEADLRAQRDAALAEAEKLLVLVKSAYNEAFAEGMKEHSTHKGGKPWFDSVTRTKLSAVSPAPATAGKTK